MTLDETARRSGDVLRRLRASTLNNPHEREVLRVGGHGTLVDTSLRGTEPWCRTLDDAAAQRGCGPDRRATKKSHPAGRGAGTTPPVRRCRSVRGSARLAG